MDREVKHSSVHIIEGNLVSDPEAQQRHASELNELITQAHSFFLTLRATRPNSVLDTPLLPSAWLSTARTKTFIKLETEQLTNAFKVRGAVNRVHHALEQGAQCIVTASTGNHAAAVVHALSLFRAPGLIFLPSTAKPGKIAVLRAAALASQVDVRFAGEDCLQAELVAAAYASEHGAVYISPYNDRLVIAGQGTTAVEILASLARLEEDEHITPGRKCCYVTVGGGGLVAGIAACLKVRQPGIWRVVGCLPHNSPVMYDCVTAGKVVSSACIDTLSDGSAGDIEEGSITVGLCAKLVDAWALISEDDIAEAIRGMFINHRKVLEGAAGVALAGFQQDSEWREKNECDTAVVIACGGNIDPETFVNIICKS